MALLQCCFESADYVELIQGEEEPKAVTKSFSRLQAASSEPARPPRRLPEIICAITVTMVSMVAGAGVGQQLWVLLRIRTVDWCEDAPTVFSLGLDAAHLGKSAHAFYCSHMRMEPSMETASALCMAMIFGPLVLRLTFGSSYFASWTEEEEIHELERLYKERGRGESLVLSAWRMRRLGLFVFDIAVAMWFRYYLDLYLDIQAMKIFWLHGDIWFFISNFGGIVLGLLWTAVEFYKILREGDGDSGLPGWQVLIVGLLIPLAGLHVTYLSLVSLIAGTKHRFLFISTLAESVLESAVSAFVQTYAVVFSKLSLADKVDLYSSIALSFVSIGYAFSALDKYDGGELMVKVPGLCRGSNGKWWSVFIFRIAEVTSRATSLALFQCVWRPWGIVSVMAADTVVVVSMAAIFQYSRGLKYGRAAGQLLRHNLVYALPSSICLMTPMLEKDSPMTLPPEIYYSLRILELAGMFGLMGYKLEWDVESARELYKDDAIIIFFFALSTLVMITLCVILRQAVAVRTLLEAPAEMWHMRPFNVTQQVLRNRILGLDAGVARSRAWTLEQRQIVARIRAAPFRSSAYIRADLDDMTKDMSQAEFDARFLGAKVSCSLDSALLSLSSTWEAIEATKVGSTRKRSGRKISRKNISNELFQGDSSTRHSGTHSGSLGRISSVGSPLRTGSLMNIRGTGGGLTSTEDGPVAMRWAGDTVDQKFVVVPADDEVNFGLAGSSALGEPIISGGLVRLRSLRDGGLLRLVASDKGNQALPDEEGAQAFDAWSLETRDDSRVGVEPETLFSFMLWREEEYRSARRFALSVKPLNKGCLEVRSFHPSGSGDAPPSDFVENGWRIAAINGHVATAEQVEEILAQARQDMEEDQISEDTAAQSLGGSQILARNDSLVSSKSGPGASKAVKYRVSFEKAYGNDMVVGLGSRVVLRVASVAGSGAAAGAAVGFGLEIGHGPSGLEPGAGTRAIRVSADADPLPLTLEPAEIGSRDDAPLYSWAAEEIRRRNEASQLRASLAEKCRVAVVVGFNARANRLKGAGILACTREMHLRMLRLFASLVRGYREIEVEFDGRDEILEELRFMGNDNGDAAQPLVVQAVDAEDGCAAVAGVQPGDEVVEAEVDRNGNRDSLHRSVKELREVLGLGADPSKRGFRPARLAPPAATVPGASGSPVPSGASHPIALLFRSPIRRPVDSDLQKVLVSEACLAAQLLPTWEEIARPEDYGGEAPSCRAAAAARLLRHDEFFRLRCSLVTNLLQQGWELQYAGFAESALMIHQHLDALTRDALRARFPGTDEAAKQLREGLLSEQMDVLTAAWAAVPRAVKEQQPESLRKLFRHDVELVAMHDAVDAAYKAWTAQTRDSIAIVEMPGALQRFVERVRPPYSVEAKSLSSSWILRAWFGQEHQREYESVQRIVSHFTEIYENTEQYWVHKLEGAATRMEKTQEQLEKALESADMRIALIPSNGAAEELKRIQMLLDPEKLVLKSDLQLGDQADAQLIPAGLKLVRRGQVFDRFKSKVDNAELHRRLPELAPADGSDLRLLFGGDDYNQARSQAIEAIGELGAIIRVVKTASDAFPDVALQCQELLDKHHKGELRAVTQENKRRIQIQEKEAEEMVRTANIRLMLAENQKKAAEEKFHEAEEERVMAEVAKAEAQKRADQWWDNLQVMVKEKEALVSVKQQLEDEKSEWMKVQNLMEVEKSQLQADIESAKAERKKLEISSEKWLKTLQTYKAQAEEKEAYLKEIQVIVQNQQDETAKRETSAVEEQTNFTVTQLLTVISKAFQSEALEVPDGQGTARMFSRLYSSAPE